MSNKNKLMTWGDIINKIDVSGKPILNPLRNSIMRKHGGRLDEVDYIPSLVMINKVKLKEGCRNVIE